MLGKDLEEGEGSDARVEGLVILEAAGTRVLDDVKNEFARLPCVGVDDILVGNLGLPLFLSAR